MSYYFLYKSEGEGQFYPILSFSSEDIVEISDYPIGGFNSLKELYQFAMEKGELIGASECLLLSDEAYNNALVAVGRDQEFFKQAFHKYGTRVPLDNHKKESFLSKIFN